MPFPNGQPKPPVVVRLTGSYNLKMSTCELQELGMPKKPAILSAPSFLEALALRSGKSGPLRVKQVHRWILQRGILDFAAMTDLPATFRQDLIREMTPLASKVGNCRVSTDSTEKLLIRLSDGNEVESVLMREADRCTVCVSTQVGCGMGCVFCASGINGVARNLTTGEILEQLIHARSRLTADERLSHVVVMGMGEPLANLKNLLGALEVACHPDGMGISARHITISTVGLPDKIRELADAGKKHHLAVSLHAPEDHLRTRLMPTNQKTGIRDILDAADYYFRSTGRQVTFEYILLAGLNDFPAQADVLGRLLSNRKTHVNLIPFNPVPGLEFRRPLPEAVGLFREILESHRVTTTVRKRKGADIAAACGQLRREALVNQDIGLSLPDHC